ncbi:MAG: hypothetical protein JSU63_16765 [Phycisphaerales bacterium]|nr:MAG: hypothetical protein JSU63_16765 [Phycisphaerales bacterium]
MIKRMITAIRLSSLTVLALAGCNSLAGAPDMGDSGDTDGLVSDVATKALSVASAVGGVDGFGGTLMDGYYDHMPAHMGFTVQSDLAPADGSLTVRLHNEADEPCEFHLAYFAGHLGLQERLLDVEVAVGEQVTVDLPCSEIVGAGSLDSPGEAGCHLQSGEAIFNTMAVPGFFGQDFACDSVYEVFLTPDVDDLDGDGDTEELIILSDGMRFHLMDGGPHGHLHGHGQGMMGTHMWSF